MARHIGEAVVATVVAVGELLMVEAQHFGSVRADLGPMPRPNDVLEHSRHGRVLQRRELRLRQEYFFVSASLQDLIKRHLSSDGQLRNLPSKVAVQLNDTHPTISIVELMRILLDEHQIGWDTAWGIVTNKAERFTLPLVRSLPTLAPAAVLVGGDTTPFAKPHPAPLLEAASRLGLAPEQCIYVGDDERDIVAGLSAGMGTVAATYGYLGQQTDISRWNAHLHIDSPMALLKFLNKA